MENISKEIQSALNEIRKMMDSGKSFIGREFMDMTFSLQCSLEPSKFSYPEEWYFIHRIATSNWHRFGELD